MIFRDFLSRGICSTSFSKGGDFLSCGGTVDIIAVLCKGGTLRLILVGDSIH